MNSLMDKDGYSAFLTEIKDRIRKAQYEALKSVNKELIALYWDIGDRCIANGTVTKPQGIL